MIASGTGCRGEGGSMSVELLVNVDVDDLDAATEFYASGLGPRPETGGRGSR
jgi:hypothetical protein